MTLSLSENSKSQVALVATPVAMDESKVAELKAATVVVSAIFGQMGGGNLQGFGRVN